MGRPAGVKKGDKKPPVLIISTEKRVGEVVDASGKLSENLTYLINSIDALSDRLEPVLSGGPSEDSPTGISPYASRLAQDINVETERVGHANSRINSLLARLEL